MPIRVPKLDDRTYADLLQEALTIIPRYAPRWTNHNASDPGITLVELFAYVTEILLYRIDHLSNPTKANILALLTGSKTVQIDEPLDIALRRACAELRRPFRAVTSEDFEMLALEATSEMRSVDRVRCFPRRNLDRVIDDALGEDRAGHISLVFIPADPWAPPEAVEAIRSMLVDYFEVRRLLTCRLHVCGPRYVDVTIRLKVAVEPGIDRSNLGSLIDKHLERFLHPLAGGPQGTGWPFGRSIYTSDVHRCLDQISGIDHVSLVEFSVNDSKRLYANDVNEVIEVRIRAEELVRVRIADLSFE